MFDLNVFLKAQFREKNVSCFFKENFTLAKTHESFLGEYNCHFRPFWDPWIGSKLVLNCILTFKLGSVL
jgi:hypothetical protein